MTTKTDKKRLLSSVLCLLFPVLYSLPAADAGVFKKTEMAEVNCAAVKMQLFY